MFKWKKKGIIFIPHNNHSWMYSHAQCPFTLEFDDFVRVYFSTRENYSKNGMSRSSGGFIDLEKNNLKNILKVSSEPLLDFGGIGEFDEFGSMPNSIIKHNSEYYLYYCGWTRGVSTPYSWEIGFAKSKDAIKFKKIGKGPLLGPTLYEPYLHACPVVYKIAEDEWHMFYLSGIKWLQDDEKIESQYLLMHATSEDGVNWIREAKIIIPPEVENESQTSAAIIFLNGKYHMFFSYRHGINFRASKGRGYKIGYASSDDLKIWTRDDSQAGINVSDDGWDSEMIAYPHIANINGKFVMFYCGNQFGKGGFGFAELEM